MFQEFPMWVSHPEKEARIVANEAEFVALGDGWVKPERVDLVAREHTPDYVEYPKWVGDQLVQNAEEESALLGSDNPDTRAALLQIAEEKGIRIDKRWSDDKIRAALEAA
ncbi:hypothetical protein PEP31012_03706 [Pandoraea eparura]|uniref:Uncharacterized protein n=2 Tax=Pandoraea eparura TaxID=2508291 RepID=A0A5E4X5Q8_9BURK|nr:hypothetical protein PEP31012_03706 [Pandoraea eparura]